MARKKLYKDYVDKHILEKITFYKREGKTDEQIYKMIGISRGLGIRWKDENREFFEAFKRGNEESLMAVENAFYRRALGHFVTEEEITIKEDGQGNIIEKITKKKKRYIYNDINSQLILKRRNNEKWGDKLEVNIEDNKACILGDLEKILKRSDKNG